MTIRHPANVKNILASGVDSLVISISIDWKDDTIFSVLDGFKEKAQEYGIDYPGIINKFNDTSGWIFNIKPHGTKGFTWILGGSDFTFKIADSSSPSTRPNAMVEFRSETLWRLSPNEAIKIALGVIEANGGRIIEAKLSRVDLCLDFLMSEKVWSQSLMEYAVTRATNYNPYYTNKKLTGIRIGSGTISARLYDKALEIQQQSKKYWMHDIWGISEPPAGEKIIRIEFQLRRAVLKELGLKTVEDLNPKIDGAWAYCTKKWLKFQDRPGLHHTQRSTFRWYEEIQDGFNGIQGANPLIREKALRIDKQKMMQQANGLIMALHAISQEEKGIDQDHPVDIKDCLDSFVEELANDMPRQEVVQEKVKRKRCKYHREKPPIEDGQKIYKLRRCEE